MPGTVQADFFPLAASHFNLRRKKRQRSRHASSSIPIGRTRGPRFSAREFLRRPSAPRCISSLCRAAQKPLSFCELMALLSRLPRRRHEESRSIASRRRSMRNGDAAVTGCCRSCEITIRSFDKGNLRGAVMRELGVSKVSLDIRRIMATDGQDRSDFCAQRHTARKGIVERLHRTLLDDHLRADALHRPKFWRT